MSEKKKIAVIGDGGWGTALSLVLVENGHDVTLWGAFPDYVERLMESRENASFLPGVALPSELTITSDRAEATRDADLALFVVPTRYFAAVAESFKGLLDSSCSVVSAAKGLDERTRERMTVIAGKALGTGPVVALSGPSHAEEVARKIPTAVVLACEDHDRAKEAAAIFANNRFRTYTSTDVTGVELGGALKNIVAIAVGVSDGIGFGDNTRAALITRGLAEIARLGCALGAERETFSGLSGMGDLIVTCSSELSRNRAVGERLGKGETLDEVLGSTQQAVEGIWNCAIARDLAREVSVETPITEQVYGIVHEGKDPHRAVEELMTRESRAETE